MGDDIDLTDLIFGSFIGQAALAKHYRNIKATAKAITPMDKTKIQRTEDYNLSKDDIDRMEWFDTWNTKLIEALDNIKQFNVGDYLIAKQFFDDSVVKNSYGVPVKFKVIGISPAGIPMVKQLNWENKPSGDMICVLHAYLGEGFASTADRWGTHSRGGVPNLYFEVDSDYAESILIGSEYDASIKHKQKKSLREEINNHNKLHKLNLKSVAEAVKSLSLIKKGDVLWVSSKRYFTVTGVSTINAPKGTVDNIKGESFRYPHKLQDTVMLSVTLQDGSTAQYLPHHLTKTNLYTACPRSLKELSDLI